MIDYGQSTAHFSPRNTRAPARSIDIIGTIPDPPATNSEGWASFGFQLKGPPIGPLSSNASPGCMARWKYCDTSPSGMSSTVSSILPKIVVKHSEETIHVYQLYLKEM